MLLGSHDVASGWRSGRRGGMMNILEFATDLRRKPWIAYPVAAGLFGMAFLLHWEAGQQGFPFVTFIPAVMLSALLGGLRPGLLVALASGAAAWYFFLPHDSRFGLVWPSGYAAIVLYAGTIAVNLWIIEALYRSLQRQRAEKALTATMFRELQHRVANNLQFIGSMLSVQRR